MDPQFQKLNFFPLSHSQNPELIDDDIDKDKIFA